MRHDTGFPLADLSERRCFYLLMNIESYPDFLPTAKVLATRYLEEAIAKLDRPESLHETLRRFDYSHEALDERLNAVYDHLSTERDKVLDNSTHESRKYFGFWTKERVRERLIQFAPFNLTDGAWLQNVSRVGTVGKAQAMLFSIWADEFGNGNDSENHSNVYRDLLNSIGVYLADTRSLNFAEDSQFLDSAFSAPVFQLSISQFSSTFLPEIIGMTLWLEWSAPPEMQVIVELLKSYAYNAHFYSLHVGIDNPVNGHGALAKEIVRLYLDEVRRTGGEDAVQAQWQRIWTGYVAFQTAGTLGKDLERRLQNPRSIRRRMIDLIKRYERHASKMHLGRSLVDPETKTARPINDWFRDPEGFLLALVANNFVVAGKPRESRLLRLLEFDGPMYKVFGAKDIALIEEWILSLEHATEPARVTDTPGDAVAEMVDHFRQLALSVSAHQKLKLSGPDPHDPAQTRDEPVSWWLDLKNASTQQFLVALGLDERYVISGKPDESPLLTKYLQGSRAMAQRLGEKNIGIVRDWILHDTPRPGDQPDITAFALFMDTELPRTADELGPRRRVLGMGAVH